MLLVERDVPVQDDVEVAGTLSAAVGSQQEQAAVWTDVVRESWHIRVGAFDNDLGLPRPKTRAVGRSLEDRRREESVSVALENRRAVFGEDGLLAAVQRHAVGSVASNGACIDLVSSMRNPYESKLVHATSPTPKNCCSRRLQCPCCRNVTPITSAVSW